MPLVPESRRSRQDVKASIGSQFWEQPVHSTKSVDGQLWSLPCEPPALNLTGSSSLSRTQQLLAAQAVRVPLFPSYDGSSEGLVLDRVLAKGGGQRWWAALSGRIKAQRAYRLATADGNASKVDAVRDLGNYALCGRGRFQLGRRLTLNGVAEAPDAHQLRRRLAQRLQQHRASRAAAAGPALEAPGAGLGSPAAPAGGLEGAAGPATLAAGPAPAAAAEAPELEPCRAHATLRCALPGHDLSATAGYNLQYADSTGEVSHVPLAVSLDLASHDRQDGLQYRVGLHQVTAPLTEVPAKPGMAQRWRTSLHAQGALAVEGEAYIWKAAGGGNGSNGGGSSPLLGSPGGPPAPDGVPRQAGKGGGSEEEGAGEEPPRGKLASALASAAAADEQAAALPRKQKRGRQGGAEGEEGGRTAEAAPAAGPAAASSAGSATSGGPQQPAATGGEGSPPAPGVTLEEFMRPLEQFGGQVGEMLHQVTHPGAKQQVQQGGGGGAADGGPPGEAGPRSATLLGLSADSITATIQESAELLRQLRQSVERLTGNVQDGSLQRLSQQLADSRQAPARRRPYSMLLSQPHLKLNAALGCLARMPLPAQRAFSFPHASLEPLDPSGGGGTPLHTRPASTSSLASRASHSSHLADAWQPYFKATALRVFGSAAVSGQLGRFTRPWLDFTSASARVDVGLTSPHVVGVLPDPSTLAPDSSHRPDKHRAFALEGRGAWHALSVSLAQQVFGPLRARVDARFALDPTSVPASEGERSTLKGVLQTALSMRPSLLETVYGFDCVLPGTEGAARLAVWCSPKRRECMAELRLF